MRELKGADIKFYTFSLKYTLKIKAKILQHTWQEMETILLLIYEKQRKVDKSKFHGYPSKTYSILGLKNRTVSMMHVWLMAESGFILSTTYDFLSPSEVIPERKTKVKLLIMLNMAQNTGQRERSTEREREVFYTFERRSCGNN